MSKSKLLRKSGLALAVCAFSLKATREVQLLPAGRFVARDGRPEGVPGWVINADIAAQVIAHAAARRTPLVIDYEHQTLNAEQNGLPAPAAAFFKTLEWREGDGLYATDVEWTANATRFIEAGEYRFISPVFTFDKQTGAVRELLMAAVTNNPALDGMDELCARAAARYQLQVSSDTEEDSMNKILLAMLAALGLSESATEEQAMAALKALQGKADSATTKDTEIAALKTATPDPAKYVPVTVVEELRGQVAALTARVNAEETREVDALIKAALGDGRLLPAQEQWARDLAKANVASLRTYVASATPIAALKGKQTEGNPGGASDTKQLSAEELAVCKTTGISAEDFLKAKAD